MIILVTMPLGSQAGSSRFSARFGIMITSPAGLTLTEIAHIT